MAMQIHWWLIPETGVEGKRREEKREKEEEDLVEKKNEKRNEILIHVY